MASTTVTMSFSETPKLFTISLLVNPFPIKSMISFSSFKLSFLEDLGSSSHCSTSVSRFCLHHVTSCGLLLLPVFLNNDDTIFSTLLMLQFMYSSPISLFVIPFSTRLITFCSSGVKYISFISSKETLGIVVCSAAVSSTIGCKTLTFDVAFISSFISIRSLYIDAKDGLSASLPSSNAEESEIVLSGLLFLCRRSDFISFISRFISSIGIVESLLSADDSR
mmetsp:Transcript_32703/g.55767  ORF Transcript_32703/g.55767 Transcript_32703/m.55767 type:complete len:222 (-) Transcript_32703:732-1397(-)